MNSLSDLLNFVVSTLQASPLCEELHIVETISFSEDQFRFRVRAELHQSTSIQVHIYVNGEHIDYAYQLLRDKMPLLRWDNKEHFPALDSYPHHFHNADRVERSSLTGHPENDLPWILEYLSAYLK